MDTFVELKAIITDFQAKMAVARGEMDAVEKKGGSSFQSVGKYAQLGLLAVAAGAVAVGVESTRMASKFQSDMELLHTQAGVAQSAIGGLSKQVLALAGPTATAPDALADALYHLMSNGLRGASAMDALKVAAEGAKVGHADLTDVTNALGAVIASNISGIKNYTQAMGVMNATVGSGDMHMQDLADAFSTGLLASVKGFGVSIQDVGAALATFGDNNIRGAQAGTELRMAVQALAKPAATGKAALEAIGLSTTKLASDMATGGLKKAIDDLQTHLTAAGDTGTKMGAVLTDAFGKKAGIGIQVLEGQVTRFNGKFGEISKAAGTFGDAWAQTQQTFSFKMQQAQASVEALGIKIGLVLIPIIQRAALIIAGMVQWLDKNRQALVVLGIAVGVVAATFLVLAASAAAAWVAENAATLGIVAGIELLVVAIIYLSTHWKQVWADIKKWFDDAVKFLRSGFGTLAIFIMTGPLFGAIIYIALHWQQLWTGAKNVFNTFVSAMRTLFSTLYNNTIGAIINLATKIGSEFTGIVYGVLVIMGKLPGDLWNIAKAAIGDLWSGLVSAMTSLPGLLVSAMKRYITGPILSFFGIKSPSSVMFNVGKNLMQGLAGGIAAHAKAPAQALTAVQGPISTAFAQYQQLGQAMAAFVGWTGPNWVALNNLVMSESGWNPAAQNPTSSAYGIAQNIGGPAGYAPYGTSPQGQIDWMFAYIKGRYGNPQAAWQHELAYHWYDQGGLLPPGLSLALNTTGRAEVVSPGGTGGAVGGGDLVIQLGSQEFARIAGPVLRTWLLQEQRRSPLGIRAS